MLQATSQYQPAAAMLLVQNPLPRQRPGVSVMFARVQAGLNIIHTPVVTTRSIAPHAVRLSIRPIAISHVPPAVVKAILNTNLKRDISNKQIYRL